ncbi:hypothetical protein GWK47_001266 [Chionoecetes opilio]|uniref:Uncharacterized protein n=1 Tax=Chionoecetes opilio TaxID=41210 RepID=A0A8J4XXD7_CHIOP|nr:hypothetical protein GWK47_001266 [Chionoecetes opilio]
MHTIGLHAAFASHRPHSDWLHTPPPPPPPRTLSTPPLLRPSSSPHIPLPHPSPLCSHGDSTRTLLYVFPRPSFYVSSASLVSPIRASLPHRPGLLTTAATASMFPNNAASVVYTDENGQVSPPPPPLTPTPLCRSLAPPHLPDLPHPHPASLLCASLPHNTPNTPLLHPASCASPLSPAAS